MSSQVPVPTYVAQRCEAVARASSPTSCDLSATFCDPRPRHGQGLVPIYASDRLRCWELRGKWRSGYEGRRRSPNTPTRLSRCPLRHVIGPGCQSPSFSRQSPKTETGKKAVAGQSGEKKSKIKLPKIQRESLPSADGRSSMPGASRSQRCRPRAISTLRNARNQPRQSAL